MAIYHFSAQVISRGKGKSSVAAAAYRSGEKLVDERTGLEHDYTRKQGIEYTEILTPSNAPEWANDRNKLWNEVEKIEKSKDSQLAREINIALPVELSKDQQIELTRQYVQENFVNKGMVADIAIHDKSDGNPHAHVMLTMRPFNEDGTWGAKAKKEYMLDKNGEKIKLKSGEFKSRKIETTDWNKKETLEAWREQWSNYANNALERAGVDERIDHRTLQAQGMDREPQIHVGVHANAMEKRKNIRTERGTRNNEIKELNRRIEEIKKECIVYLQEYKELKEDKNSAIEVEKQELKSSINTITAQLQIWDEQRKIRRDANWYLSNCGLFEIAEKRRLKDIVDKANSVLDSLGYDFIKYENLQAELKDKIKKLNKLNDLDKKPIVKENVEVKRKVEYVDRNIGHTVSKTLNAVSAISSGRGKDEDKQAEQVITIGATIIGGVIGAAKKIQEKENIKVSNKAEVAAPLQQFEFNASLEDINIFKAIGTDTISFKDLENLLKKESLNVKLKVFEKFFDMVDSKYLKEENMDIKGKEKFVLTDKGKELINKGIQGYKDYRDIRKEQYKDNKEMRHKSKNIDRESR